MRVVIQRVKKASVRVGPVVTGKIDKGLLILLGVEHEDTEEDLQWLTNKIVGLRVFSDEDGKMNNSIGDVNGSILVVSQFTLHASTKKGNRPSFIKAASPAFAEAMYKAFISRMQKDFGFDVQEGQFAAMMDVELVNDGPVTIIIDSKIKE